MALHDELEQLQLPQKLVDETISKDEYIQYLLRLHALHSDIEPQLQKFDWGVVGLTLENYLRLPMIEKDLQSLQAPVPNKSSQDLEIASFDEALGYLYVLTGSTMGGMILSQKVLKLFNGAHCYFSAFGQHTQQRWMQFLGALSHHGQQNGTTSEDAIITGAINCYGVVKRRLDEQCKI